MDMYARVRDLTGRVEALEARVGALQGGASLTPEEFTGLRAAEAVKAVAEADAAALAAYAAAERALPKPRQSVLDALRERGVENPG